MNVSLFKRLAEAHPEAVVCLSSQYRMNEDVMGLCNHLVYDHRLKSGSDLVAKSTVQLPKYDLFLDLMSSSVFFCQIHSQLPFLYSWRVSSRSPPFVVSPSLPWLQECLCPKRSVIFLDTDTAIPREIQFQTTGRLNVTNNEYALSDSGQGVINPFEIFIIKLILNAFELCGVDLTKVGVVTPYRAQVKYLLSELKGVNLWGGEYDSGTCATVSTVDKFQGRDMDIIIFSTVRNNSQESVGFDQSLP
jgi:DNA replication ATP-dependent helicase Dna2